MIHRLDSVPHELEVEEGFTVFRVLEEVGESHFGQERGWHTRLVVVWGTKTFVDPAFRLRVVASSFCLDFT